MCVIKACYVIGIWFFIPSTFTQRRIHNGEEVEADHPYAVYLLKAGSSERMYKGWTCGGSIVSPDYIVTSAACVEDVKHMYAIAGYKKFVEYERLNYNQCTSYTKKKIVFTCVPKLYEFEFHQIERWALTDIALVKVESPYDFSDTSYINQQCSYTPAPIQINYEQRYQTPGTDAMALGWGHKDKWRARTDYKSYNTEILNYASTIILDKPQCKEMYKTENNTEQNREFLRIIDRYMICTLEHGVFNDKGEILVTSKPEMEGCDDDGITPEHERRNLNMHSLDNRRVEDITNVSSETTTKGTEAVEETTENKGSTAYEAGPRGICQNDHGGPLVTWAGGHKILIGVASVFKIVEGACTGPYLFTSTQCNGKFLDCILRPSLSPETNTPKFRRSCDALPAEKGFDIIERRISWIDHPAGPAANEVYETRPQVPISKYHFGFK